MLSAFDFVNVALFFIVLAEFLIVRPLILLIIIKFIIKIYEYSINLRLDT